VKKLKYFEHYVDIMKKATDEVARLAVENDQEMEEEGQD
jgi:hypothetical protein